MKHIHSTIILLTVLITWSSCRPALYFPDRVNTPGFTHAGQVYGTISVKPQNDGTDSAGPRGSGASASFDAGVAVTDHFAIIGSYRGLHNRGVNEGNSMTKVGGFFNGKRYEIGAGYYSGKPRSVMFEAYGGIGFGYIHRDGYFTPKYNFSSNYNTYFIQAGIGGNWDYFRLSTGMKITAYHFNTFNSAATPELRYNITQEGHADNDDVTKQVFTFMSPYMDMELGYKFIMLNLQQGLSGQITGNRIYGYPFYMTIGLSLRLGPELWNTHSNNTNINE